MSPKKFDQTNGLAGLNLQERRGILPSKPYKVVEGRNVTPPINTYNVTRYVEGISRFLKEINTGHARLQEFLAENQEEQFEIYVNTETWGPQAAAIVHACFAAKPSSFILASMAATQDFFDVPYLASFPEKQLTIKVNSSRRLPFAGRDPQIAFAQTLTTQRDTIAGLDLEGSWLHPESVKSYKAFFEGNEALQELTLCQTYCSETHLEDVLSGNTHIEKLGVYWTNATDTNRRLRSQPPVTFIGGNQVIRELHLYEIGMGGEHLAGLRDALKEHKGLEVVNLGCNGLDTVLFANNEQHLARLIDTAWTHMENAQPGFGSDLEFEQEAILMGANNYVLDKAKYLREHVLPRMLPEHLRPVLHPEFHCGSGTTSVDDITGLVSVIGSIPGLHIVDLNCCGLGALGKRKEKINKELATMILGSDCLEQLNNGANSLTDFISDSEGPRRVMPSALQRAIAGTNAMRSEDTPKLHVIGDER